VAQLQVKIIRFVDAAQPGWVECELQDAHGHRHVFVDKIPIFTESTLD